ncbi:MAG: tetratricopeptide repeat protein [Kofleriaceae bacterium]|nr:tetratricopeptide repeat protein [Kofleriaceae bacterium]
MTHYQCVLDANPDDRRALAALESIYRDANDVTRLAETLLRQASLPDVGDDERVAAFAEAADLLAAQGRQDDAISTWDQLLELAPQYQPAFAGLEKLYGEQERWHDVVELYERRLGFAAKVEDAVALRVQMAEVCETKIHDLAAAVDNYGAALINDPHSVPAASALRRLLDNPDARLDAAETLEPIYVASQRWAELVQVYEARLHAANDPEKRIRALGQLARLQEEQLEDFDQASFWYGRLFLESPDDESVRDQLHRLASITGNWAHVVAAYEEFLRDTREESELVRDIAVALGVVHDRRNHDAGMALPFYRRALLIAPAADVQPTTAQLVARLEEIYNERKGYAALVEVYDYVVATGDSTERRVALAKRAVVQETLLASPDRAIESWRELMVDIPDAPAATALRVGAPATSGDVEAEWLRAATELERLYRSRGQLLEVVELLESRLVRSESTAASSELRLALAQLQLDRQDTTGAIDQYEQVLIERVGWERAVARLEQLVVEPGARERVIELLEPIYRRENWWQKLVVILDAKREYLFEDEQKVATLHEIAALHYQRGGDHALARKALLDAWRTDVGNAASVTKLLDAARLDNAWDEVLAAFQAGIPTCEDSVLRAELWQQVAQVQEQELADVAGAVASWRKAIIEQPEDAVALSALDRLLALQQNYSELVPVVLRRAALADDVGVRAVLLHRAGAYCEENLRQPVEAIAAFRAAAEVDPSDVTALDALQRLYIITEQWREVAEVIERKLEQDPTTPDRLALHTLAAQTYESKLADVHRGIAHWQALLEVDARNALALRELDRCYAAQHMWPELIDVLDQRAVLALASAERAELAYRAARIVAEQQHDLDAAIARYGGVLQVLPTHEAAKQALFAALSDDDFAEVAAALLERLCRSENDVPGLIKVLERRTELASHGHDGDLGDRRQLWSQLAEAHEVLANDVLGGFAVWSRALQATPEDLELLGPLRRLAASHKLWPQFAALLQNLLTRSLDSDVEHAFAMEYGTIQEDYLRDLPLAEQAYERASRVGDAAPALAGLERVLARAGRAEQLAVVLARQADAASSDSIRAEYLYRRGDLLESVLHQTGLAVAAFTETLLAEPGHRGAREALHRLLQGPIEYRSQIVEVLMPLCEADGDFVKLSEVLDAKRSVAVSDDDRRDILQQLIELREHQLQDSGGALDAAMSLHQIALGDEHALREIERLAERTGSWRSVAESLSADGQTLRQQANPDPNDVVRLHSMLGSIYAERLAQPERAIEAYLYAFAADCHSLAVVDELIALYRRQNSATGLIGMLQARGGLVDDPAAKRAAYFEVADLCDVTGDSDGAIAAWRAAIALDETDRDALHRLTSLYTRVGRIDDLKATLQQGIRVAANGAEEIQLRQRLAALYTDSNDHAGALAQWQAIVDVDPLDLTAMRTLEGLHAGQRDWDAVRELKLRRADGSALPSDRLAIVGEIAQLDEQQRQRPDDAIATWYGALELDPRHGPAFDGLERLLRSSERWHDVVELLERRAEVCAADGDASGEIRALATIADIWEGPLDSPDAAAEVLEKILRRDAASVAALTRLSKVYQRNHDVEKCQRTLEQALALGPTGRDAADLYVRLADVAGEGPVAKEHLRRALEFDASHIGAATALEAMARAQHDDVLLETLLLGRLARTPAEAQAGVYTELARLVGARGADAEALPYLERAVALRGTQDAELQLALADALVKAGQFDRAAPMFEQLATAAKAAKRLKDAGRYRQRQGALLLQQGEVTAAQAAYEEAFRVQPTDPYTMVGLGRIYVQTAAWESARRIYQSLVLQAMDPVVAQELGVSKGQLYLALGRVHKAMAQLDKAKAMFQRGLEFEVGLPELVAELAAIG